MLRVPNKRVDMYIRNVLTQFTENGKGYILYLNKNVLYSKRFEYVEMGCKKQRDASFNKRWDKHETSLQIKRDTAVFIYQV